MFIFKITIDNTCRLFDTARDYGNGKCTKILGELASEEVYLSSKYTPFRKYRKRKVIEALEKDLKDFNRSYVDIYWLHMPNDIEENLKEMIYLYQQGKIRHIGVSNFNLKECQLAKNILDAAGIPLYGVQNHYSIVCKDWENNGLLEWCHKYRIQFWAWSSLEGGLLAGPVKISGIMGMIGGRKAKKFMPLYQVMKQIGEKYGLSISQVAIAYYESKGVVPMCGCRRAKRVKELAEASQIQLTGQELIQINQTVEKYKIKNLGSDVFRFAVRKRQ